MIGFAVSTSHARPALSPFVRIPPCTNLCKVSTPAYRRAFIYSLLFCDGANLHTDPDYSLDAGFRIGAEVLVKLDACGRGENDDVGGATVLSLQS